MMSRTILRAYRQFKMPYLLASILLITTPAFALEGIRKTTNDGLPLNEAIQLRLGDEYFKVPAGYLWPWPTLKMRNQIHEMRELALEFWMPDRRYVEVNPISYGGFRPQEAGRAKPNLDAYVVSVRHLQLVKVDEAGYVSPEKGFKNLTSITGLADYSFKNEEFGLISFSRNTAIDPFTNYRHLEKTDPQVLLHCTPPDQPHPNPNCHGTIHFQQDNLGFFFNFPRDQLRHWREIAVAVRDLFNSWRVKR